MHAVVVANGANKSSITFMWTVAITTPVTIKSHSYTDVMAFKKHHKVVMVLLSIFPGR